MAIFVSIFIHLLFDYSLIVLFIFFFVWNVNVYLIVCVKRLEQYWIGNIQILIIIIIIIIIIISSRLQRRFIISLFS